MLRKNRMRSLIVFPLLLILGVTHFAVPGSKQSKDDKELPRGTPVLWRKPVNIASRDLFLGPGGRQMKPDLSRLTFIEEEKGGWSKKYRLRDGSGQEWVAKIGREAQPETVVVRLLWATGYETEINYLVPRIQIPGKGTFDNVRFEARPKGIKRLDEWKWDSNPFVGTREFQGLKVMMVLVNNWDIKDSNNKILLVRNNNELRYIISDLGATFGQSGSTPIFWRITRSRNEPGKYAKADFVDAVKDNHVSFHYGGKHSSLFDDITVEDAHWMGSWLARLSTRQISDAFRAANYRPAEVSLLTRAVRERINELLRLRADRVDRKP